MRYGLTRTVAPTAEPVSLAEAKNHLRVDTDLTADDSLIGVLIQAARERVESWLGQALITQTWQLTLDAFPVWELELPRPPLIAVSSVQYVDGNGTTQTLSSTLYRVDSASRPARIEPAYGQIWPSTRDVSNAAIVTYTAGYGAAGSAVPAAIRQAMLLAIGHWYRNREEVVTGTIATKLPETVEVLLAGQWHGHYG